MQALWNDLIYGLRMFLKSPGFTLVAVITLAVGIGANTALFSVVNGVLLNPLPYFQPERLATVSQRTAQFERASVSYPNFLDWQRDNHSFQLMAALRSDDFNLTGEGQAERLRGDMASAAFFPLLGIQPVLGRNFSPAEDTLGAPPVVVIGSGLWRRKFDSSPAILGKTIQLNGTAFTVIGVIPSNSYLEPNNDIYVPLGQWTEPTFRDRRMSFGMRVLGRLAPGITFQQARTDMDRIARNLAASYPEADAGKGITTSPLKQDIVGDVQPFLVMLLAAVAFVLLIACANIANLLLARCTGRMHEFAVRAAIGAGRTRIVRQLLTESLLLALAGGAAGLLLAAWGTRAVLAALPDALPRANEIRLDAHVLAFTLVITILAGVLFGLAPAFRISHSNIRQVLTESGRGLSGRQRMQSALVVAEIALALVLLFGSGLMLRTLTHLWSVNPGFNPHNVLTFGFSVAPALIANPSASRAALCELHDRIQAVPGVEAVSAAGGSLPMESDSELPFWLDGQPEPAQDSQKNLALFYLNQPDYLKAMGIPLLRGRFFNAHDDEHAPMVAAIDEVFARKYFPNQDPMGKRLNLTLLGKAEIVGVVGHIKHWGLDSDSSNLVQAQIHFSVLQVPDPLMPLVARGITVVLRSHGAPLALEPAIRQAVRQMNNEQVLYNFHPLDTVISWSLAARRFSMILLGLFAVAALVLSAIGLYGVISCIVGQRTREVGIRAALGAQGSDVLRLIMSQGMKMAFIGVALGAAAALALARLISKMLFGVSPSDPLTLIAVAMLLVFVTLVACYIPARRAMRVDPTSALRAE